LAKAFAAMDVQLFFSRWGECFSTTICEAASVGLPTIAGANPLRDNGQSEQLIDGENGYLVATHEQAIERVSKLIADPRLTQSLKQQTFDYAHARWSTAQIAQDLLAFYNAWTQPEPAETPHLKWVAETERSFADGYRPRVVGLLADGPLARLKWEAKLAAVRSWTAFRLGGKLKRFIR
ncbi:MAG: glycosyltransferase, partial [Planctomycetota bacterium]